MEIVVCEPVRDCVACLGGTLGLREEPLPPRMVCIQVSHKYTVSQQLDGWKNIGQRFWSAGGIKIKEGKLFPISWRGDCSA